MQNIGKVSTVTAGSITLGVGVGPRQFIADQLLAGQLCHDPQTEFALPRESWRQSYQPHPPVHGHTILQEKRAAEIYGEVEQRSLERPFLGSRKRA